MFKVNEHYIDRIIRIVLAVILGIAGLYLQGAARIVLWVLALVLLITGLTGFCGIYALLGIDTCSLSKEKKDK
ncbi:MAG: YgaP family membrane protein [Brevinematia bacterium]